MAKISLMALTIDRIDTTKLVLTENLKRAQHPELEIELLIADNGSSDRRIVQFLKSLKPAYLRLNSRNEGCAHAYNQLFLRASGQFLVTMSNDLLMPANWLWDMFDLYRKIPNAGVVGADWGHGSLPPISTKLGVSARWASPELNRVFGVWFFSRRVIEEIGFGHEGYGPYGLEDSDMMERMNLAGFNSCYHPTMKAEHKGADVGQKSAYRKMKDESLQKNAGIYSQRAARFHLDGVKEPLPPMRDPL